MCSVHRTRSPVPSIAAAWAAALGAVYVDFATVVVEPEAAAILPRAVSREHRCVPVSIGPAGLLVAFESPLDGRTTVQRRVRRRPAGWARASTSVWPIRTPSQAGLAAAYGGSEPVIAPAATPRPARPSCTGSSTGCSRWAARTSTSPPTSRRSSASSAS